MRRLALPGTPEPNPEETAMNSNYGLATADRLTHLKIVAVALVACIAIIGAGKAAYQGGSDNTGRMEVRVLKIDASKLVVMAGDARVVR